MTRPAEGEKITQEQALELVADARGWLVEHCYIILDGENAYPTDKCETLYRDWFRVFNNHQAIGVLERDFDRALAEYGLSAPPDVPYEAVCVLIADYIARFQTAYRKKIDRELGSRRMRG